MNDEQYAEIIGALRANEQEHSSYNRRLHEHDEKIDKLQQTQVQLANLTNAVNNLASGIGEVKTAVQSVDKRVGELEREPADKWKKITWEIVKAVVMAAVGAGIAILTKGA
jgi:predicted  nucleic acid-binding Zn-ribbon protein